MARKYSRRQRAAMQVKANPAYASFVTFNNLPQPHSMPRAYKNFAEEGYGGNDTVFKVINYIIENGAAIPPKLFTDESMTKELPSDHPVLQLLKKPNVEQTGVDLREAMLGYFLISGNAYMLAIRPNPNKPPAELWALQPDKVKAVVDKVKGIVGYNFDDYSDEQNPIPAPNIGRIKTWNPTDPIYGKSPLEVGAIMVDQQTAAMKWNLALMQNSGKIQGVMIAPVALGKNERDALEVKVNDKFAGPRNAGRIPVLDAGMKWQQTAISPSDMDWKTTRSTNAIGLANLYNIAPQLIGDTSASTYDNYNQAKAASYTEAIFPLLDRFYAMLTNWLLPMFGLDAFLYYDKTTIEVLQEVIQAQKTAEAQRAVTAYEAGACTLNQALEAQGFEDIGDAGNVYRIGAVLVPADKLLDYAEQSLTEPAAPPVPQAEPIPAGMPGDLNAPQGAPGATNPPPDDAKPEDQPPPKQPAKTPPPSNGKALRVPRRKASGVTTHLLWECDAKACDWCLQNDGVIVALGDSFPNGCTSPDDSHRFCQCQAHELSIPDGTDISGRDMTALIALFGVGLLASRHARDVAARQAALEAAQRRRGQEISDEMDDDDEDDAIEDDAGAQYAAPGKPKKPKARDGRSEYREFMRAAGL